MSLFQIIDVSIMTTIMKASQVPEFNEIMATFYFLKEKYWDLWFLVPYFYLRKDRFYIINKWEFVMVIIFEVVMCSEACWIWSIKHA